MTPFEEFFQANYPQDVDPLWKMKLAACWNAAIDAALKTEALWNASSAEAEEVEDLKVKNS